MSYNDTLRSIYRHPTRMLASPQTQIEALLARRAAGNVGSGADIPPIPAWSASTHSEVLLLLEVLPADSDMSLVARTFLYHWNAIELEKKLDLDLETLSDLVGEPEPGLEWVAFDPRGMLIHEESDFRADVFMGLPHHPGLLVPGLARPRLGEGWEPAGLEVFAAIASFPELMREAWVGSRNDRLWPIIPRLQAITERGYGMGHLEVGWWDQHRIRAYGHDWSYNHYGHPWVVPTVRRFA